VRHHALRWMLGPPAMVLALLVGSAPVEADYVQPSPANSLLGELSAFVADFSHWNASHGNQPLSILENAPDQDRGQTLFVLFWFWLHSPRDGAANDGSPLPPQMPKMSGNSPPSANGSGGPPIGSIVSPLPQTPPNGSATPPIGSILGGQSGGGSLTPSPSGSTDPAGIGDNSSSGSSLGTLSPRGPGLNNGPEPGSPPLLSGASPNEPRPLADPPSVPEPATLTLLSTGALGFLMCWRANRRTTRGLPQNPSGTN
jgi:hypothetical protein